MNETHTFQSTPTKRGAVVKVLAILGFIVTVLVIIWLIITGIKHAPTAFNSLAEMARGIQNYRPVTEITLELEKDVVNSGESFQISWTNVKQAGEYHFSYNCTDGISLEVRGGDGTLVPVRCTEVLTLPSDVHGLFLSVTSDAMRFTDVPLGVTFTNEKKDAEIKGESKVTVVNATIPTKEQPIVVTPEPAKPVVTSTPKPTTPVYVAPTPQAPIITFVYPESDPHGYTDLKATTLGSGILYGNTFTYTSEFDEDLRNAVRFDIKNIGTKTSGSWTFKTTLPNGQTYTSKSQKGLKPNEHVEFTMGFDLDDDTQSTVKITTTVDTNNDTNSKNDRSTWSVRVND